MSYEVFYGQFLAIVLLVVGVAVLRRLPLRPVVSVLISLGVAQILAVVWYLKVSNNLPAASDRLLTDGFR